MIKTELLPTVAIMMSTYNGEKFIREQLDSILIQKKVSVYIYIRDDGSTDGTVGIINDYSESYSNIKLIQDNKNLGPGLSFMTVLEGVVSLEKGYEYYAFADQDDIWLEEKLIKAIEQIKMYNKPVLYCSNQWIYRDGNIEGKRYKVPPELTLKGNLTRNLFSGCTYVFNHCLAKLIVNCGMPDKNILICRCHDSWVTSIALLVGKVVYDHDSFIKYRIHNDNVIGVKKRTLFMRIKQLVERQTSDSIRNISMKHAKVLRDLFAGFYSDNEKAVLDEFADYKESLSKRLTLMFDKDAAKDSGQNYLMFIFKVLVGYI